MQIRLLMIEDSEDDAALILRELRRGGFEPQFKRVDSAESMRAALDEDNWDIVVCDYSMPHFSGKDALKLLRDTGSDIPFIFVSGTIGEDTAVAALKEGAQDYVMKGHLKRLVPAIMREMKEAEHQRQRRQLEREVQQLQKFESIGRLAGGIAHDFNNALGIISGFAEMGSEYASPESPIRDALDKIKDQAKRSAGLTAQLLAFASRQVLQPRRLDLNTLVTETAGLLRGAIGRHIEINLRLAPEVHPILADPTQIEQVLMNLSINARDVMPKGGTITIKTENVDLKENDPARHPASCKPGSYVLLEVTDTGSGIDAATLDHIFEPFFTTKEAGKGTGLGLSTVYGIVNQHGGVVTVETTVGKGTTFRVFLPSASPS
ncbi:MAG TPA: ATP-binding protein [Candidatus Sulfotelmatobacter sp.]|nr:ATP-binding protein [Candidatus Sulfotelmatobacter sp.]